MLIAQLECACFLQLSLIRYHYCPEIWMLCQQPFKSTPVLISMLLKLVLLVCLVKRARQVPAMDSNCLCLVVMLLYKQ